MKHTHDCLVGIRDSAWRKAIKPLKYLKYRLQTLSLFLPKNSAQLSEPLL